jgi:hypothetical protein
MADQDILQIISLLCAAYPNAHITPETITVYVVTLRHYDPETLRAAALHCVSRCKFFPTVAEINEAITNLAEHATGQPTAAEAWGIVLRAIRKYGHTLYGGHRPRFENQVIEKVVGYFGWNDLCLSENEVADRARFIEAYTVELRRERERATMLPEVKALADKLSAPRRLAALPAAASAKEVRDDR